MADKTRAAWFVAVIVGFVMCFPRFCHGEDVKTLWRQATEAADKGDSKAAVATLNKLLSLDEKQAEAYYLRGREHFRLGNIKESLHDFDHYVKLNPRRERSLWERGITQYYAKQFQAGAKQFELYQTYHDNDVENSTWRYLCVARSKDVKTAQGNMLPIRNDRRVPMMEIYDLYRGRLKPADVLKAAHEKAEKGEAQNRALFYAHLYVGLYFEVQGDAKAAKEHLLLAKKRKIGHFMWDVANVHVMLLK